MVFLPIRNCSQFAFWVLTFDTEQKQAKGVKPMKYGRKGSSHEVSKQVRLSQHRANTGVMQQSDAAIAVKSPAPINFCLFFILFPKFYFREVF
ncbi:MAG: hypothetical protein IPN15_22435 [Saprospiraceae bacterium]|nr:hypothetical protein [Candidatus Vicinibacter affinis]